MTVMFVCGTCGKRLKAPTEAVGRKGRCTGCQAEFYVPDPGGPTVPVPPPAAGDAPPPAVVPVPTPDRVPVMGRPSNRLALPPPDKDDEAEHRECPFCGEGVKARAKKCKHCGETIDVALRKAEEKGRSSRRRSGVSVRQATYVDAGPRFYKAPFNHALHLVLDLITCGAWVPIHLICWACH
jgi:hypothetical protein